MDVRLQNNIIQMKQHDSGAEYTPQIWCVGAGKGGVGKSFITSSLAICLSKLGHSVTLVDLDIGGANLHTCLGVQPRSQSLRNFIDGSCTNLDKLQCTTDIPNVYMVPGFWDAWSQINISPNDRMRVKQGIEKLHSHFVIMDLGAGAHEFNMDFMRFADQRIIITTPEPSSIENAYRFMEAYMFHILNETCAPHQLRQIVEHVRNTRANRQMATFSFQQMLKKIDLRLADEMVKNMNENHLKLVINQSRTHADTELGNSMTAIAQKYFGVYTDYIGALQFDNAVWQSLRKRKPPLLDNPFNWLVGQFLTITKHLLDPEILKGVG